MNKKGVIDDWADVMWTVAVVGVVLFLLLTFAGSEENRIKAANKDRDLQIDRDGVLLNYLRTPVANTNFVSARFIKTISQDKLNSMANFAAQNNMNIADLFILIASDRDYVTLIQTITENDEFYSKQKITADLSEYFENQDQFRISEPKCDGKTSTVHIPVEGKETIMVRITICK